MPDMTFWATQGNAVPVPVTGTGNTGDTQTPRPTATLRQRTHRLQLAELLVRTPEETQDLLAPFVRGETRVVLLGREQLERLSVETQRVAVRALRENLARLNADGARVERIDALDWLREPGSPFEIVLLDPPFGQGLLAPVCALLERGGWLAPTAWIYLEAEAEGERPPLPDRWAPYREKKAGAIIYRLARRENPAVAAHPAPAVGRAP